MTSKQKKHLISTLKKVNKIIMKAYPDQDAEVPPIIEQVSGEISDELEYLTE